MTLTPRVLLTLALAALLALTSSPLLAGKGRGKPGGGDPPIANPAYVYAVDVNKGFDIYVATADGSSDQKIVSTEKDKGSVRWSEAGDRVAFLEVPDTGYIWRDLYMVDRQADDSWGDPYLVHDWTNDPDSDEPFPMHGIDWSPDGEWVLYDYSGGGPPGVGDVLYLMDLTTDPHTLIQLPTWEVPGRENSRFPSFSPDLDPVTAGYQGFISWTGWGTGGTHLFGASLTIGSDRTPMIGHATQLADEASFTGGTLWSPLSTMSQQELVSQGTILTIQELLVTDTRPAAGGGTWSPDGMYFASAHRWLVKPPYKRDSDIFRIRADGSEPEPTNVTEPLGRWEYSPDWNPAWLNDLD